MYDENYLLKNLNSFFNKNKILRSVKFMNNDKKKDDDKVSFIFLESIGKTTLPGSHKYNTKQIENVINKLF